MIEYTLHLKNFEKFAVVVVVVGSRDHRLNPSPSTWTGLDWTGTRAWQFLSCGILNSHLPNSFKQAEKLKSLSRDENLVYGTDDVDKQ